jgi:hypothetical protein
MDDELRPVRANIAQIITKYEHVPIMAEDFIGFKTPKKIIEDKVDACDAYIGIFHYKWGSIPQSENPKKLSVTTIEFYRAKEKNMPILVLISDKEKETELENFIKDISDYENGIWRNKYKDFDELYGFVYRGIPSLVDHIEKPISITNETKIDFLYDLNDAASELKDVSELEVANILKNLQKSIDENFLENQWVRLENIAIDQRLWKVKEIWNELNLQIIYYENKKFTQRAISVLMKIIINSKRDSDNNVIYYMKKHHHFSYLIKIFFDLSINDDLKIILRDLFIDIYDQKVRFLLYWKYWKVLLQIKCEREFIKRIQVIMHDFKVISNNNKLQIEEELIEFLSSSNNDIKNRAQNLYSYLFR